MARSGGISGHSPSRILENITPWHLKAQTRYDPFYVMEVTHDANTKETASSSAARYRSYTKAAREIDRAMGEEAIREATIGP